MPLQLTTNRASNSQKRFESTNRRSIIPSEECDATHMFSDIIATPLFRLGSFSASAISGL